MSYSRWLTSRWYTFWNVTKKNGEPCFTICEFEDDFNFSYSELSKSMAECLKEVQIGTKCSDEEIKELAKYMQEFINDVEEEGLHVKK